MGQAEARLKSPHMANPHYLSSIYRLIVLMFGTQCPKGSGHRLQFLALGCQRISPIFQLTSPTLQFLGSLASASGCPTEFLVGTNKPLQFNWVKWGTIRE